MKIFKMTNTKREAISGLLFISPWIIGFLFLFLGPLISSFIYSFNKVTINNGIKMEFKGLAFITKAFTEDAAFPQNLAKSLSALPVDVIYIVIFSLFIALILNQKFRGRLLMRAIFFLPVIITSGVVIGIIKGDVVSQMFLTGSKSGGVGTNPAAIFDLSWKAGIQILLYLAGLQSIPRQLYEVASIEGATGWESFWKITFPMISSITLLNVVYTIIDSFTDYTNPVMKKIIDAARVLDFSYSSAQAWIYFLIIGVVLVVAYAIVNRFVFYEN